MKNTFISGWEIILFMYKVGAEGHAYIVHTDVSVSPRIIFKNGDTCIKKTGCKCITGFL